MRIVKDYNTLFHRCITRTYPYKTRELKDAVSLSVPLYSYRYSLENPIPNFTTNPTYTSDVVVLGNYNNEDLLWSILDSDKEYILLMCCKDDIHHGSYAGCISWFNTTFFTLYKIDEILKDSIKKDEDGNYLFALDDGQIRNYFETKTSRKPHQNIWCLGSGKTVLNTDSTFSNVSLSNTTIYFRPSLWIKKSAINAYLLNPVYLQKVEQTGESYLSIRDQLSDHNAYLSAGSIYKEYEKNKRDVAVSTYKVTNGVEDTAVPEYYYILECNKTYYPPSQVDGLYFDHYTLAIVDNGMQYKTCLGVGNNLYLNVFLDTFTVSYEKESDLIHTLYLDCWSDIYSNLFAYLPVYGDSWRSNYWLGINFLDLDDYYNLSDNIEDILIEYIAPKLYHLYGNYVGPQYL